MRIIIELDNNTQPEVQMGSGTTANTGATQGASFASGKAIDAGAPKVGAAQLQTSSQETGSSGSENYQQQPATDSGSAGSAPSNLNG